MGIVYVLSNPAFDSLKIGRTSDLEKRLMQLNNTSVPFPFRVEFAIEIKHDGALERAIHHVFADHRVNPKREFFDVSLSQVMAALNLSAGRDVTPASDLDDDEESAQAVVAATKRKAGKSFADVGISVGTTLAFMGKPNVTAEVVSDKSILFEGEDMSLSKSALIVLHRDGKTWPTVNGWEYWTLNAESLAARSKRLRLEE